MGEAQAFELRKGLEEALGEADEALATLLILRPDAAAEGLDRVVAAPQDPVVDAEPVVVELVSAVAHSLAALPAD